jgi:nucleoid-associated protein YgaU
MSRDHGSGSAGAAARGLLVWSTTVAGDLLVAVLVTPELSAAEACRRAGQLGTQPLDRLLLWVAALAAVAAATWLTVAAAVAVVDAVRDRPGQRHPLVVPALLRRVVLAACGGVLASGATVLPAQAGDHPVPAHAGPVPVVGLAGLALPDRTEGGLVPRAADRPAPVPTPTRVRVRPGDSLWAIAERMLPRGADDAAVDARWRRIHRLNADHVPDPDLIRPGTVLRVPGH